VTERSTALTAPTASGAPPRWLGFCSAFVLLVLLVTAGLPAEGCGGIGREPVAVRCDGHRAREDRSLVRAVAERTAAVVAVATSRPRPLGRYRQVQCRGLPPPRAPTA